ncbi:MAG: hypothetical protein H0V12_02705 [Chloroflexi bacterium]|nr:hypothetical protein [Chloroflexota bacterium]
MIRLRTAVRAMPALWFAIPISILAGWYVTFLAPSDRYTVDATAKGTAALPFVAAFCAACAAWEGSRLRRARLWAAPSVRSRVAIVTWCLLPVVLVGLLAIGIAIAVALVRSSAGLPDPRFIAMTMLDLVALSVAGFATGLLLPIVVAGPLAIVASFIWLAFVPAFEPVWLRHLTGMFRDCCGLADDLAPQAILASSIVNLGIIGAVAVLVAGPPLRALRVGGVLAALVTVGIAGVILVGGMTYAPVIPRDSALLACRARGTVTVCTWPEHQARAAEVAEIVGRVRAGWQQAGIDAPAVFTEANPAVAPGGALAFGFNGIMSTEDDIINSLATGMLPAFPDCPGGATGGIALEYLAAWYAATGGMTPERLHERYGYATDPYPEVLTVVDQLQAAAPDVRRSWVLRAEEVSQACDEWPLKLIAVHP